MIIISGDRTLEYDPEIPSIFSEEGALRVVTIEGDAYDRLSGQYTKHYVRLRGILLHFRILRLQALRILLDKF